MQRPTVNLRAGSNISFGLTSTDGDPAFDTLTINSAAAGGGGGGSSAPLTPTFYQVARANGTNTITAIASGRRLIVAITSYGGTVTAVACTNVTFTQVGTDLSFGGNKTSIWIGVATGTSGTSVTFTGSGTILNIIVEVADTLTPTLGTQTTATNASAYWEIGVRPAFTAGTMVIATAMTDNTATFVMTHMAFPHTSVPLATSVQATSLAVGYAPSGDAYMYGFSSGASSGAIYTVSVT
jgi:hypothetical protein